MSSGIDVLMDPVTGDLPVHTQIVGGQAVTAQRVSARMRTILGDWPLDTTAGVDWIGFFAEKPVDVDAFAALLVVEITDTPGVTGVADVESTNDNEGNAVITMSVFTEDTEAAFGLRVSAVGSDGNPSIVVGGVIGHSRTVVP